MGVRAFLPQGLNSLLPSMQQYFYMFIKIFCSINCSHQSNRGCVLQQHNDPKHKSKTAEWLQKKKMSYLEWPSQSPDLNPFVMLWDDLKRAIHTRHPGNVTELQQFCKEEWNKIHPHCSCLICNSRKYFVEVNAAK